MILRVTMGERTKAARLTIARLVATYGPSQITCCLASLQLLSISILLEHVT